MHVGNDVVDLRAPGTKGRSADKRYIDKILTLQEKEAVFGSIDPDRLFWVMWAAKETAYKSVSKADPDISSSPLKYPVRLAGKSVQDESFGFVETPAGPVGIMFYSNGEYVHCFGPVEKGTHTPGLEWEVRRVPSGSTPEYQSSIVRKMVRSQVARLSDCSPDEVDVVRKEVSRGLGPPIVYVRGEISGFDISLSHHGRFAACALWAGTGAILRSRK